MNRRDEAFRLKLSGLSYREVAKRLGISPQRVVQLTRAPKAIYAGVLERAGGKCQNCGVVVTHGHVHHIATVDMTPDRYNDPENLAYLCQSCHRAAHVRPKAPVAEVRHARRIRKNLEELLNSTISTRLSVEDHERFQAVARERHLTDSELARWLIRRVLQEMNP